MTAFNETLLSMYQITNDEFLKMREEQLIEALENEKTYNLAFSALVIKCKRSFAAYKKFAAIVDENEAISIFLECVWQGANRFVKGKSLFTTFIYSYFYRMLINEGIKVNRHKNIANLNTFDIDDVGGKSLYNENLNLKLQIKTDSRLSEIQKEIFLMTVEGYTLKQIKEKLKISANTVRKIKEKLIIYKEDYI